MFDKNIEKKTYKMIGTIFILLGIAIMGLSFDFYLNPIKNTDYAQLKDKTVNDCHDAVRLISSNSPTSKFKFNNLGNTYYIYLRGLNDIKENIYKSTNIISNCKNMNLINYCAGNQCVSQTLINHFNNNASNTNNNKSKEVANKNVNQHNKNQHSNINGTMPENKPKSNVRPDIKFDGIFIKLEFAYKDKI